MKKLLLLIPVLLIAGIFFYACQDNSLTDPEMSNGKLDRISSTAVCGNILEFPLLAGNCNNNSSQTEVGKVYVSNDAVFVYVEF